MIVGHPVLSYNFVKCKIQVNYLLSLFQVTCGGCHMLVLAKPRDKSCQEVTLEENDVTEDYMEKSYTELLGDTLTSTPAILNSSLSARVRRRERVGTGLGVHTCKSGSVGSLNIQSLNRHMSLG